ncbi:zinc knuckle domain containing protein [Elysia marginata]|uniref:Zinc knuckle domain containing protein n=1 Tax=Elysia marginata TaxID=1093978 RepID=A0AAV4I3D6_9GAST|nr:zinc knuckle domain containing protein [Elysia marginata]
MKVFSNHPLAAFVVPRSSCTRSRALSQSSADRDSLPMPCHGNRRRVESSSIQRDEIIAPVEHSESATPIVPVLQRDGTVRICGDCKTTLNKVCKEDNHPIPDINDLAYG